MDDNRARSFPDSEYRSVVAKFLEEFAKYYQTEVTSFCPTRLNHGAEERRYFRNYKYIKRQVQSGVYDDKDMPDNSRQDDVEHEQIQQNDFKQKGLFSLFEKLDTLPSQAEKNRAISDIALTAKSSGLVRMILFSYYLLESVVLTRVETRDEDYAFDIFDALNTTGEPLTALETFKPRIIHFEGNISGSGYSGSKTEADFKRLEANLNDIYPETEKRQQSTKELLVTFALYLEGHKLPLDLASQRRYLRTKFEEAQGRNLKRKIVKSLADIAEFRQTYWNQYSIPLLNIRHSNKVSARLKLCCMFILEMKTSLAIPILARYWVQYQQNRDEDPPSLKLYKR